VLDEDAPPLAGVFASLGARGIAVAPVEYEKHLDERRVPVTFVATVARDASAELVEVVEGLPGVRRVRIEPPAG